MIFSSTFNRLLFGVSPKRSVIPKALILICIIITVSLLIYRPQYVENVKNILPQPRSLEPVFNYSIKRKLITKFGASPVFIYEDVQTNLCNEVMQLDRKTHLDGDKDVCPLQGIVSVVRGGNIGNQMWEYASVWAVARRTGLEPYIPRCIKLKLDQIFEQLTVPAFEEIAHCPVEFNTFVKSIEEWTFTNQSIILPRYTLKPKLVLTWVQDIIQEFRFRKKLREKAQQIITSLLRKLPPKDYTFIGVHVRRTDYIGYLKRKYGESPITRQFFINAMAYYKNKYPDCLFIFISDDPNWCYQHFGRKKDVYVASYKTKNTPALDLALMAACNHSIFDYGTFGEWGSILAGGETVYSNMTQNIRKGTGRIMKNWIAME